MLTAIGTIRYDPRSGESFDPWWVIVDCDPGRIRPYREQVEKETGRTLEPPFWGAHISVVMGEKPPLPERWKLRDGEEVTFSYCDTVQNVGGYWWIEVKCADLLDLRERLGLPRDPKYPLHLTIGRLTKSDEVLPKTSGTPD